MADIDLWRKGQLAVAEFVDAWRIVPRLLVAGYGYVVYTVIMWYKELKPYMLEGCQSDVVKDCIVQAPTTQHAALVTAVVGMAAVVFGLYANSGKKWNGFTYWNKKTTDDA